MTLSASGIAALIALWTGYAVIHSLLASHTVKRRISQRWPGAARAYRLLFNLLAALLLLPPLWLTWALRGPSLWQWRGAWAWIADAAAVMAVAGLAWSSRHYDMESFSGLAQWRAGAGASTDGNESLRISPLHRYVRHPWYFLALVALWTRDMDLARLTSALSITAYLWLGSLLEERKLLAVHGAVYARYRERVSGLVPLPWKTLDKTAADALVSGGKSPAPTMPLRKGSGRV